MRQGPAGEKRVALTVGRDQRLDPPHEQPEYCRAIGEPVVRRHRQNEEPFAWLPWPSDSRWLSRGALDNRPHDVATDEAAGRRPGHSARALGSWRRAAARLSLACRRIANPARGRCSISARLIGSTKSWRTAALRSRRFDLSRRFRSRRPLPRHRRLRDRGPDRRREESSIQRTFAKARPRRVTALLRTRPAAARAPKRRARR
jgi:hypothetical protein